MGEGGENENKYRLFTIDGTIRNHCFRVNCPAKSKRSKNGTEVEALKKRISELEGKLQTVENVEKMELAAKLAEAHAEAMQNLSIQNLVN